MPISVDNAYIETYQNNVIHLAQQQQSKLRGYVMELHKQSEAHNWDTLAASTARDKTSARLASPGGGSGSGAVGSTDQLTWARRKSLVATKDWGDVYEREDIVQMLIDPKSAAVQNGVAAMNRKMDDVIISAGNDPSRDGDGNSVTFPAGQIIGGATTVISVDTFLELQELFAQNDIEQDVQKCFVIGPTQQRKLMSLLEVTSADYQEKKALANGYLPNFLGFDIIVSNRLGNTTTPPTAGQIYCLAFTKQAIGLHIARDIEAMAAERPDMSFSWQCYMDATYGAIRVEDEHLVRVHLKDALS